MSEIIEINGQRYRQVERRQPPKRASVIRAMASVLALTGEMGFGGTYRRKRPQVDIVQEYGRIQRKESKLSRNDRDWVCQVFKENFVILKD